MPLTKINPNGLDLNLRPESMKLLEENIGTEFLDVGLSNEFLDMTSRVWATK